MKIKFLIIPIFYIIIFGCKHQVPIVSTNEFYRINVDSAQEHIDLKLSDIGENFRLVKLETSEKSLISARDYYVSDKYIIAFSQDGYYKFSSNGNFLNKILSYGRGPDEISGIGYAHYYDEKNDLIYLEDANLNNKLLVYDLHKDKFVTPIKKAIEGNWGSFTIFNDSLIIGRSPTYIAKPYALFFQTFNGKFVSGIPNVKKRLLGTNPKETHQPSFFCIGKDNIRISFQLDDTLYTLNNNELVPYIIIVFKKPRETPPNAKVQKGDREIIFPGIEPTSFLIIGVSIIEEITWFTPNSGKSQTSLKYFFFNKLNGKHSIIRTYVDDFSGSIQSPEEGGIKFPLFLKNGKIVVVYEPKLIKQIAEDGQINSILTPILKNQIGEINESLQETDNPILLIGRVKEKI